MADITKGYTGISFPFRIGIRGGVVLSSTDRHAMPHIEESIVQILGTRRMERWMEYHIFSDLDSFVFEPNDRTVQTLLAHQVGEALKQDRRIRLINCEIRADDEILWVDIHYRVIRYQTNRRLNVPFERKTGQMRTALMPMHDS